MSELSSELPPSVTNAERVVRVQLYPSAKRCYQRISKRDPALQGRMVVRIDVAPRGQVKRATVTANTGLPDDLIACVMQTVTALRFDPPCGEGSTLSVPLTFRGAEPDAGAPDGGPGN